MLDRIHRVKFDNLTLDDKLIITRDYILPEISKNLGLDNTIIINNETIKYLIETYTNESGVRKLKELLFEILGDINLEILKNNNEYTLPYILSINTINRILREKSKIKRVKINNLSKVGVINGLWANALGKGGILHIESSYINTSNQLELKLTGMQGDVIKESIQVEKKLSWNLLDLETKTQLKKLLNKQNNKVFIYMYQKEQRQKMVLLLVQQ